VTRDLRNGHLEAVKHILAPLGWHINTAFVERINLSIRQHVAAVGRRVSTLCKGEDGLQQQLALYHVYYNFCLPPQQLTPGAAASRGDQWWRLSQAVAAMYASDGGRVDRSGVEPARGTPIPRAAVAAAPSAVSGAEPDDCGMTGDRCVREEAKRAARGSETLMEDLMMG
jgi:hypothetical protein